MCIRDRFVALSKQAGEQRDKGKADKGNAAARHQLFQDVYKRQGFGLGFRPMG